MGYRARILRERHITVVRAGALVVLALAIVACGRDSAGELAAPAAPMTCMPQPSACGFPDASNTGVSPGTALTPESGSVTLSTPGQVYENRVLTGSITVAAPNVTIRNVKLVATDDGYGIKAFSWEHDVSGLTLDHVEIDLNGHYDIKGIAFDGYTARNVYFHNGADCAHMGRDVVIESSYCVLGPDANGDGQPDDAAFCRGPQHFDGFQSDGGRNITLRHNTIRNPCAQTAAILLSTNTERIEGVTIDQNLVSGGGYTVYCGTREGGVAASSTYTRNVVSREFFRNGGRWGPTTWCDRVATSSGNIWDGEYVPDGGGRAPAGGPSAQDVPARLTLAAAKRSARRALARRIGRGYTRRAKGATVRCSRRSATVIRCAVRWSRRRGTRTTDSYTGTVVVSQVAASRRRCAIAVRHRSPRARSPRIRRTVSC